jgi:hypothetical protein
MPSAKEIQDLGITALRRYLCSRLRLSDDEICDVRNKGRSRPSLGCDVTFQYAGTMRYVELKALLGPKLPANIRFTHQTIASFHEAGLLGRLIVSVVYNLKDGVDAASFLFLRLGALPPSAINVEPHFLIQPNRLRAASSTCAAAFSDQIDDALAASDPILDLDALFDAPVRKYMRWSEPG